MLCSRVVRFRDAVSQSNESVSIRIIMLKSIGDDVLASNDVLASMLVLSDVGNGGFSSNFAFKNVLCLQVSPCSALEHHAFESCYTS